MDILCRIFPGEALFIVVSMQQPLVCTGLEEAMSRRSCSITWHSFSPWHNLSKLSSAHGLPKELLLVVKVVQVVFPTQQRVWERHNNLSTCTVEITQYALKGQKILAQGIALGNYERQPVRPVRAKALKKQAINNSFALTGRLVDCYYTQGGALGYGLLGFQPALTVQFTIFSDELDDGNLEPLSSRSL